MLALRRAWCQAPRQLRAWTASMSTATSGSAQSSAPSPTPNPADLRPKYKYAIPDELLADAPETVRRSLSIENANSTERKQAEKIGYIRALGLRPGDTGSTPVQVACLTVRIRAIEQHLASNKQDKFTKRGYTGLMTRRRRLMAYLRRKDFRAYRNIIEVLGLKGFS